MHHHTVLSFVDEFQWVSSLHYLKNGWQNAVLFWCMLQAGPPTLHYYCAVVLHSCTVLPPVGHSSNHEYHCCQLTRQSSSVSNFYRTFKVFIWLSLVFTACNCIICDFSAFHNCLIKESGHVGCAVASLGASRRLKGTVSPLYARFQASWTLNHWGWGRQVPSKRLELLTRQDRSWHFEGGKNLLSLSGILTSQCSCHYTDKAFPARP